MRISSHCFRLHKLTILYCTRMQARLANATKGSGPKNIDFLYTHPAFGKRIKVSFVLRSCAVVAVLIVITTLMLIFSRNSFSTTCFQKHKPSELQIQLAQRHGRTGMLSASFWDPSPWFNLAPQVKNGYFDEVSPRLYYRLSPLYSNCKIISYTIAED